MAIFKTNFDVILPGDEEVGLYYEAATKRINLLLEHFNIRNEKGRVEVVSSALLKSLISPVGFFQSTPLNSIFFAGKHQFIPQEIILAFRSILSDPPANIKALFYENFIRFMTEKGLDKSISEYIEKKYNFPPDGIIILNDLQDFSLGFGVYRLTFILRMPKREKIVLFLKRSSELRSCNERLYCFLQRELLPTSGHAQSPFLLISEKSQEKLLLSPLIPGVSSDTVLSVLTENHRDAMIYGHPHADTLGKAIEILIEAFMSHAAMGDLLGRNDRHLMNSLITPSEELSSPVRVLNYAKNILKNNGKAILLIDIDLKWLLEEKSSDWMLTEIECGLSELNLLSLLPAFNDFDRSVDTSSEIRKQYIVHYFKVYRQELGTILSKKELLLSAIKESYPLYIVQKKLNILSERIAVFEQGKAFVIDIFSRYLLNFRMRLVYKTVLVALDRVSREANNNDLAKALKASRLLKYIPSPIESHDTSVLLQLQCFRGVVSPAWDALASEISTMAEKYSNKLFMVLQEQKEFIRKDATALIQSLKADDEAYLDNRIAADVNSGSVFQLTK